MTQAFYRKWRPQKWDEVVAQDHVIQTLRNAVRSGRIGHAFLMAGPRGTGKTTTARLLAKAVNCLDPDLAKRPCDACEHCLSVDQGRYMDLVEIDAASNTSVEDVRDLRDKINYRPSQGEYKVYIIDEVHMLSTAAFNALLKTLEEPPPHAIFILATTEVHKIPATILSRVQRYDFRRIPVEDIIKHLKAMSAEEGLAVDDDALQLIARQATGAMRDAISLLDQLSSTGERVTLAEAQVVLGTATNSMVVSLVESILARDPAAGFQAIQSALDSGTDARQFARQIVDYLRSLLLIRLGNGDQVDATREMRAQMSRHASAFEAPRLLETVRLFNGAANDARGSWHPGLALELAMAETVSATQAAAPQVVAAAQPAAAQPAAQQTSAPQQPVQTPAAGQPAPARAPRPEPEYVPEEPPEAFEPARAKSQPPAAAGVRPQAAPATQPPAQRQPASAAPAQPPAQPAPAPAGELTQQALQQNWPRVKALVKRKSKMAEGLLNSSRSVVLKGDIVVLGFQSEVVKSKMETPENIDLLRQALQETFGAALGVRCAVVGGKSATPNDLDVDGDGMVGTALDLGGKIVYEE